QDPDQFPQTFFLLHYQHYRPTHHLVTLSTFNLPHLFNTSSIMSEVWHDLPSRVVQGQRSVLGQTIDNLHGFDAHFQLSQLFGAANSRAGDALDVALKMSMTVQRWMRDIPEFPTNEEELQQDNSYRTDAEFMCQMTMKQSNATCETFNELASRLEAQMSIMQQEIQRGQYEKDQLQQHIRALEAEADRPDAMQFMNPLIASMGNVAKREQLDLKRGEVENQIRQVQSKVEQSIRGIQTIPRAVEASRRFLQYFQRMLQNFTELDIVIQSAKGGNPDGASAHGDLAQAPWSRIIRDIEDAKNNM
ncbi:hypothetical protein EDB81DRAFT_898291, partial [Dactylonectria macrodidyma]